MRNDSSANKPDIVLLTIPLVVFGMRKYKRIINKAKIGFLWDSTFGSDCRTCRYLIFHILPTIVELISDPRSITRVFFEQESQL